MKPPAGYREVEHIADWELQVWAPDLPTLLEQAGRGMYALEKIHLHPAPRQTRDMRISAGDAEHLLVSFLSELLWLSENDGLAFDIFKLELDDLFLSARLHGAPIAEQAKEIKAVTFHNLSIHKTDCGLEVNIVFDV
jgi:SHS2 domain-containing protein